MNYYLCVDNFNGVLDLTIGKVYSSIRETEDLIWVINDLGYENEYAIHNYFILSVFFLQGFIFVKF